MMPIKLVQEWIFKFCCTFMLNNYCMAKRQKKQQNPNPTRAQNSKTNIGRPEDDKLETYFMKKLRNGKLQVISAESQAEIICYNFEDMKQTSKSMPSIDSGSSMEKVEYVKRWFENIDKERFKLLWQSFNQAAEKWQFLEINSIADFPEFLFCDQCDLSYVLHTTLHSSIEALKSKDDFSMDELLYFELLCFATRDQISWKILRTIDNQFDVVIKMMENVKNMTVQISKETLKEEKVEEEEGAGELEENDSIPRELRKGDLKNMLQKVESSSTTEKPLPKTKLIEKKLKNDKKRGRPKKNGASLNEGEMLKEDELEQVAYKLIAHIQRAYAYIYPSEVKKKLENGFHFQQDLISEI